MSHANRNTNRWRPPLVQDANMRAHAKQLKQERGVSLKGGAVNENKFDFEELNALLDADREWAIARRNVLDAIDEARAVLDTFQRGELWRAEFDTFEAFWRSHMDAALVTALTSIIPPPVPVPIPASLAPKGDINDYLELEREPPKRKRVKVS